jgi:uncharacterized protein (DUF58 family)
MNRTLYSECVKWDRSWWAKLRDTLQGGVQQQVTLFGMLFSLAIVLIGVAAFLSGNNLIFLLLAAMLATMLVSGFMSRLSLSGLRIKFLLPEHISARHKVQGRIQVQNEKTWMPSFSIQLTRLADKGTSKAAVVYFPSVPGGKTLDAPLDIYFPKRGTQRDNRFLFSSRFPFGFTERRIEVPVAQEIIIYPCLDVQPAFEELLRQLQGDIETQHRGQGSDFYRIRPYEHGESAKSVDWKATAHTGKLQVREFTRNDDKEVEMFLDLNPGKNEDWFEQAVECSAFLVWRLTGTGVAIRFRTQQFQYSTSIDGDAYGILKYLATVEPSLAGPANLANDRERYQILFTPVPPAETFSNVRVVSPAELSGPRPAAAAPSAGR